MTPSHSRKKGARYRYYVSQALIQYRKARAGSIARISAPEIEAAVSAAAPIPNRIERVTLHRNSLLIELKTADDIGEPSTISVPFAWQPQGRRKGIAHQSTQKPRLDHDSAEAILAMIARARRWMTRLIDRSMASTDEIALREGVGERNIRKLLPLACLSPKIIRAIADGTAPANLTISRLTAALPHDWASEDSRILVH